MPKTESGVATPTPTVAEGNGKATAPKVDLSKFATSMRVVDEKSVPVSGARGRKAEPNPFDEIMATAISDKNTRSFAVGDEDTATAAVNKLRAAGKTKNESVKVTIAPKDGKYVVYWRANGPIKPRQTKAEKEAAEAAKATASENVPAKSE